MSEEENKAKLEEHFFLSQISCTYGYFIFSCMFYAQLKVISQNKIKTKNQQNIDKISSTKNNSHTYIVTFSDVITTLFVLDDFLQRMKE